MPRFAYLYKRDVDVDPTTCRGGVAHPDGESYELEIGQCQRVSPRMLAFAAHMDEIEEILLHNTTSKLTAMVMQSWWALEKELKNSLKHETEKENPKS